MASWGFSGTWFPGNLPELDLLNSRKFITNSTAGKGLAGAVRFVYQIRAQHFERIDRLRRELHEQQAKMMVEAEGVLTDAQKSLLNEHRRGASKLKEQAGASTAKTDAR